jgi:hypothetical protein
MFIVQEQYQKEQLNNFNKDITIPLKAEDIYGVYISINGKFTNCRPVEGNLLGASKNNGIKTGESSNTNRFRMIIQPDQNVCKDDRLFSALLATNSIKALTGFLDKSPYKKIIKFATDKFRGISSKKPSKPVKQIKPKPVGQLDEIMGANYLVYLGSDLWKHGMVKDSIDRLDTRINEHKNDSIRKIKYFTGKDVREKIAIPFWSNQTKSPKGDEENIGKILIQYQICEGIEKIKLFSSNVSDKEDREYFICTDMDYILYKIIPALNLRN